jgi:ADP-heptose:LPS heptosyltransferase
MTSKLFGARIPNEPFSLGSLAHRARRVLVVPPSGLAEMLLVYPALVVLRKSLPDSRIICLAEEGQAELLKGEDIVDNVLEFPEFKGTGAIWRYRTFVSEIRERMIEAIFYFDFRYDFYRVMLPALCGAKLRVKLRGEIGYPLFNVEVVPGDADGYFRDLNLAMVRFMASGDGEGINWRLPEKEVRIAREIVRFRKANPSDLLVGVDLSYVKGGERPPFDVEIKLARSFAALKPCRIALLSDPRPAVKDEEIRRMGSYDWLDIPRKSFRDTLGILSQCDLLITANTNLFHFAVAMGVPSFVLFRGGDDRRWVPAGGSFKLVGEDSWASAQPARLAMELRDFVCAPASI